MAKSPQKLVISSVLTNKMSKSKNKNEYVDTYHIIRRPDQLIWEIRKDSSSKPVKTFAREVDALKYGYVLADEYGAVVFFHGRDGSAKSLR